MYADVVVDAEARGLKQAYTYRVPDELAASVGEGACVAVPFSGRELIGYVIGLTDIPPQGVDAKDLLAVIPDACTLSRPLINLAQWMSDEYIASLGAAVRAIVPEIMSASVATTVSLLTAENVSSASPNQQKVVQALVSLGGESDPDVLKMKAKVRGFGAVLRQLRDRGVVEVLRVLELPKAKPRTALAIRITDDLDEVPIEEMAARAPKQAAILKELRDAGDPIRQAEVLRRTGSSTSSPVKALVEKGLAEKTTVRVRRDPFKTAEVMRSEPRTPTREQADAIMMIREGLEAGTPQTTLLYGVTGSGKTEVYLQSIETVLAQGRSTIALVPEISLTTHLLEAYKSRFGDQVAVLHSRLSVGERYDEWRRIESGEAKIVLGARSAVFAPAGNLGLVVVDEEHEPSYKQDHSPRYSARAAAEERARGAEASVVLGSATPSIESFYRASSGEMNLAVLSHRIEERPLPEVTLVDQREEWEAGRKSIFSDPLREKIEDRLARGQQVILFVNRRGYASFILCRSCGYTPRCAHCDVSLSFHAAQRKLKCHHCNEEHPAPAVCPECEGMHIRPFGLGTERVEEEVRRIFPEAGVIRMDSDTTTKKTAYHQMLGAFREGRADILVGTQMIAKGLDFHNVTLVGVVSADTTLHIPDFRSAERTFQLLTQVSGRAGRGDLLGEVVVQSFSPEHYAVRAAVRQDYLGFYGQEIVYRRELGYPPFSRLLNITASDPIDETAMERLERIAELLRAAVPEGVEIMGPSAAPLARLRGLYRWHLVVRDRSSSGIQTLVSRVIEENGLGGPGLSLDVDPMTML